MKWHAESAHMLGMSARKVYLKMTRDADFKRLVRDRMDHRGENYTTARTAIIDKARIDHEKAVGRFFKGDRLTSVPVKRKVRAHILMHLLERFEPGRSYREPEVNAILEQAHEDYAYLRRELVDFGYLTRSEAIYRVADVAPVRPAAFAGEFPQWEAQWLPQFLGTKES